MFADIAAAVLEDAALALGAVAKRLLGREVDRLAAGKTALLENFGSNKTLRKFKAFLAYDKKEGKVIFEFEPRAAKAPAKKAAAKKTAA